MKTKKLPYKPGFTQEDVRKMLYFSVNCLTQIW